MQTLLALWNTERKPGLDLPAGIERGIEREPGANNLPAAGGAKTAALRLSTCVSVFETSSGPLEVD
jgi:hypothetical protein